MTMPDVPRGSFLVIRTDGSEETHELPAFRDGSGPRVAAVKRALGFNVLDFVTLTRRGRTADLVMIVNDMGYESRAVEDADGVTLVPVRARFPVNERATAIYHATCKPGSPGMAHEIVGDVAVIHDAD